MPPFDEEPLLNDPELLAPDLRLGLERLRDKRPSAARVAAIAAAVTMATAASANAAAQGSAQAASTASSVFATPAAKLVLAIGALGVGVAALVLSQQSTPLPAAGEGRAEIVRAGSEEPRKTEAPAPAPPDALGQAAVAPAKNAPVVAAPEPSANPAESAPSDAPSVAPSVVETAPDTKRAPLVAEAPKATESPKPVKTPAPGAVAAAPVTTSNTPSHSDAARRPAAPLPPAAAPAKASEAELLRDARQLLDASPLVALSLCDEHRRDYPGGRLTQERELIAIAALLRLGQNSSAESRAARFRADYPRSPYLRRLDRLVPP